MAEIRASFPPLENVSTGEGVPWHVVAQGDALAGKNAGAVLTARNASNQLRYIKVNDDDEVIVDTRVNDVAKLFDEGNHAGSATAQTLATLTLTASLTYTNIGWSVSCARETVFQIIKSDNAVETVLATVRAVPGAANNTINASGIEFVAGATGAQLLLIKGQNTVLLGISKMDATVWVEEVQA